MAVGQCGHAIRRLGLTPIVAPDTAGSAREVAEVADPSRAAIASALAAETYGLEVLAENIEDADQNTTRFLVLAREPEDIEPGQEPLITRLVLWRPKPSELLMAHSTFISRATFGT